LPRPGIKPCTSQFSVSWHNNHLEWPQFGFTNALTNFCAIFIAYLKRLIIAKGVSLGLFLIILMTFKKIFLLNESREKLSFQNVISTKDVCSMNVGRIKLKYTFQVRIKPWHEFVLATFCSKWIFSSYLYGLIISKAFNTFFMGNKIWIWL